MGVGSRASGKNAVTSFRPKSALVVTGVEPVCRLHTKDKTPSPFGTTPRPHLWHLAIARFLYNVAPFECQSDIRGRSDENLLLETTQQPGSDN